MKLKKQVERVFGENKLTFETGYFAKQAAGAVLVRYEDNAVLVAVTTSAGKPGFDMLPLTVDYREKFSASGKFPGGFIKREGRPSEKEILTMRLTDRPIRPLFPSWFRDEILVQGTVYSAGENYDTDVLNINGASAALMISPLPFDGPIGAVRIGSIDGEFIVNPSYTEREKSTLDLVVAATAEAIVMVESSAKEITEDVMIDALEFAHEKIKEIVEMQLELVKELGIKKEEVAEPEIDDVHKKITKAVAKFSAKVKKALCVNAKFERRDNLREIKDEILLKLAGSADDERDYKEAKLYEQKVKFVKSDFDDLVHDVIRAQIIKDKKRMDGRDFTTIRPIDILLHPFPYPHGSAAFTRGETQAAVTVTLGTGHDEQIVEGMQQEFSQNFSVHYSFPSFSVGEARAPRGPGRREIGHGKLAERALQAMLPDHEVFPYTIRVTSDIFESNGSSSMATVCGGSLAMFDAGVPMKKAVAGVAMGLVKTDDDYAVLTDILGDEDHAGDMDFKVCGTVDGVTALQMDIKCKGLTREIMLTALNQAKDARLKLLDIMHASIAEPKTDLSPNAPKITSIKIDVEKIGAVIGPQGKVIRSIQEESGATIEIEEDGTVKIFADKIAKAEKALEMVNQIIEDPEVGKIYKGKVTSVRDFGAIVEFLPGKDGLCHVSELSHDYVDRVSDVVSVGDVLEVMIKEIDSQGRVKLSRKLAIKNENPDGNNDSDRPNNRPNRNDRNRNDRNRDDRKRNDRNDRNDRDRGRNDRNDRNRGNRDNNRSGRDRDGDRNRNRDRDRNRDVKAENKDSNQNNSAENKSRSDSKENDRKDKKDNEKFDKNREQRTEKPKNEEMPKKRNPNPKKDDSKGSSDFPDTFDLFDN